MDYDCSSWMVDPSLFVVPSNIKFMDLKDLMPSGTVNDSKCSVCASLEGESKSQCLTALKCSQ